MALVIDGHEIKAVPIKPSEIAFDKEGKKEIYVDNSGKQVKKIKVQGSEFKWVYEDGTVCGDKTYKAIKGKPVKPFSKTTVIKSYDTIDICDIQYFTNNELTYLLVSSALKDKLKEMPTKAISFKYVNRGFKVYRAAAYYDPKIERILMRCFRGDLRKADLSEHENVEEISVADDGVEQMDLDALEV